MLIMADPELDEFSCSLINHMLCYTLSPSTSLESFYYYTGISLPSLQHFSSKVVYSDNLLINPCGEQGFANWHFDGHSGEWSVEQNDTYGSNPSCFVSSFEWCSLLTVLPLSHYNKKNSKLLVGSPVKRRNDCGAIAKVKVMVKNENEQLREYECYKELDLLSGTDTELNGGWELICLCVDLKEGDVSAKAVFCGVDENRWDGFYGARFGYCYARVLELDNMLF
jgi:hypothetical protein